MQERQTGFVGVPRPALKEPTSCPVPCLAKGVGGAGSGGGRAGLQVPPCQFPEAEPGGSKGACCQSKGGRSQFQEGKEGKEEEEEGGGAFGQVGVEAEHPLVALGSYYILYLLICG